MPDPFTDQEHKPTRFVPEFHPWNQQIWQDLTDEPERSNHALLFHGSPGLGKFNLAVNLAHYLLGENHSQSEQLFSAGTHPDLHMVLPEEHLEQQIELVQVAANRYLEAHKGKPKKDISIYQIRTLNAALATHPHIANMRVVIIGFSEQINRNGANALLKNLEEPPANTLFILVCNQLTVRSRCSLVHFKAPDYESAHQWLALQNKMPEPDMAGYLKNSSNAPLLAIKRHQENYLDKIKLVFSSLAKLWSGKSTVVESAGIWAKEGGSDCTAILAKILCDLSRLNAHNAPTSLFFPVQQSWLQKSASKLDQKAIFELHEQIPSFQRLLLSNVDQQLVMEQMLVKVNQLPITPRKSV